MTSPTDVARAFAGRTKGSVRVDRVTRELYSTDASPYRVLPVAVLRPEHPDDLHVAVEVCRQLGVSITPRGAGTSFTGQCVGPGLQVDCSLLDAVEWIDQERKIARVQPGARWWTLNTRAAAKGLHYGPDPATRRQCTVGGMTATNSGGTHSIVYGAAVDHFHACDVILADGRKARVDGGGGFPDDVARRLDGVRERVTPHLGPAFSTLARRGGGYQLEHLDHAARFLAGSEGTLALLEAVEVTLDPLPAERVLAVVAFDDLHAAIAAVPGLVETGPCAVEVVSKSMIDIARGDPFHSKAVSAIDPLAGALLFVEYHGFERGEAEAGFPRMERVLDAALGVRSRDHFVEPSAQAMMWAVREAGIGALSNVAGGPNLPQAFVEDTIVAVDRLPPYIEALDELFAAHRMEVVWYGHAGTGLVHVRPFLDLSDGADLERLEGLMAAVTDLVRDWGGDHSGEHGEGYARTHWNERLFGPEVYAELREIKAAFDPANLLNPGKVVDGPRTTDHLRYGTSYARRPLEVSPVSFDDYGGFAPHAERCYGSAFCRKTVGVMCPPAAATGLEEHSTRARANLLRALVAGELSLDDLGSDEAREVMDTCVGCKACKTECPARVDIARARIWWSDEMRRRHGATLLQRLIANLRVLSDAGSAIRPLANAILRSKRVRRRLGVAEARTLPSLASRPLTELLPKQSRHANGPLLYADCFTTYQDPEIGEAAARLIPGLGLAAAGCCGRVMLSEGFVEKARHTARHSAAALRSTTGPILFAEPSCMSAVTDDWGHLIGDVSDIAERCALAETAIPSDVVFPEADGSSVLFHPHCHQRALWGHAGTVDALRRVPGLEVDVPDAGCCGMAGAFGYRADRYELSVAMAERVLVPAVATTDATVVATGTSCRHQIGDLTHREAVHPLVFLARHLAG